jgi:hypothetical protein
VGCAIHLELRQRGLMLLLHASCGSPAFSALIPHIDGSSLSSSLASFVSPTFTHGHHSMRNEPSCLARQEDRGYSGHCMPYQHYNTNI